MALESEANQTGRFVIIELFSSLTFQITNPNDFLEYATKKMPKKGMPQWVKCKKRKVDGDVIGEPKDAEKSSEPFGSDIFALPWSLRDDKGQEVQKAGENNDGYKQVELM